MDGQLSGRVAVVTGAADGIGRGIARRFAAEGAKVVVADLNAVAAGVAARELGPAGMSVAVDVSVRDGVEAMVRTAVEEWGRIDILVNNAWSGGALGRVEGKPTELFEAAFRVAVLGPLWAMQAAFPTMRTQRYGRIINLCSLNGVNAHIGTAEYNTSKEALRTLTRTVAREWAPYGITANVICPAAKTAASRAVFASQPELEAAADGANPMGRLGDPEQDIAPVAVFLASEGCRYVTGNTVFADGGSHINGSPWAPDLPPVGEAS